MVSRRNVSYDVWMEYDGDRRGFRLARDETGRLLGWRPGLTPLLSEEQRTSGTFTYQQLPAVVDIPIPFDCWEPGAGVVELESVSGTCLPYSYASGVDASWGQNVYMSPAAQSTSATAIGGTGQAFLAWTSLGVFLSGGAYIYEWSGTAWTERDSSAGSHSGPVTEFNGVLFAPRSLTADVAYLSSSDGLSWTASTLSSTSAVAFGVRGRSGTNPILWKVDRDGNLTNNTDGTNGGGQWSSAIPVGHSSETVTAMLIVNDNIFVFKKEGIYLCDGVNTMDVFKAPYIVDTNGKYPVLFSDNHIYVPYGNRLLNYDPETNQYAYEFPRDDMQGNPELNGEIAAVGADERHIYFTLRNADNTNYLMKGREGRYHPAVALGTATSSSPQNLHSFGPGDIHSTNPVIVRSVGGTVTYYILPRANRSPEDDSTYEFTTTQGTIYGPWVNVNAKMFKKALNGAHILGKNLSSTEKITLKYEVDDSGVVSEILAATSDGLTSFSLGGVSAFPYTFPFDFSQDVAFHRIRYIVTMDNGLSSTSPVLQGLLFNTNLRPARKRMWEFDVVIGDDTPLVGGGISRWTGRDQESFLLGSHDERVTLRDRLGNDYVVRILNIQPGNNTLPSLTGDQMIFTVTAVELTSAA